MHRDSTLASHPEPPGSTLCSQKFFVRFVERCTLRNKSVAWKSEWHLIELPKGSFLKCLLVQKSLSPAEQISSSNFLQVFLFLLKTSRTKLISRFQARNKISIFFFNLSLQKIAKSLSRNLRIKTKYLTSLLAGVCCVHRRLEATSSFQ